jgi:lipid A ethanolaminephosphotransferase
MDSYHVIIDDKMIENIIKTDTAESLDLLSIKLLAYLILIGILPAALIMQITVIKKPLKIAMISRLKLIASSLIVAVVTILLFGNFYASFFREHKSLRFHANPSYYIYSVGKYLGSFFKHGPIPFQRIGIDAHISALDEDRELVVLVVGETARADHFSLNGYSKKTNPLLEKENIISFRNTWACGTSTAVSVPCMFSIFDHTENDKDKTLATENILDIVQRAGVHVIWLDNNSDSKGVAARIPYKNFKSPDNNPLCDIECRDIGMLQDLQKYIDENPEGDILIVLHQMGNHGPAYHKRYPKEFEIFTPTCHTNQLEKCSTEEINNAYDNAILYTDYFLSKTIDLLKNNDEQFETILYYISDHGESLGENGLYLHGLPYMIAPEAQKHVPMIMWFGDGQDLKEDINFSVLKSKIDNKYSHDNIFHTILGFMEIETSVYNADMDIVFGNQHG